MITPRIIPCPECRVGEILVGNWKGKDIPSTLEPHEKWCGYYAEKEDTSLVAPYKPMDPAERKK